MFWENIKAKGKLRLGAILALCAVVLGCAAFAFTGIFGGNFNNNSNITAEAAAADFTRDLTTPTLNFTKGGTKYNSSGTTEAGTYASNEEAWRAAINYSVASGKRAKFTLAENWVASGSVTITDAGIDDITTRTVPVFGTINTVGIGAYGNLNVPVGAKIQLDLNGKTIDRGLYRPTANGTATANLPLADSVYNPIPHGYVIAVSGTSGNNTQAKRPQLEIIDSTATAGYDVTATGIFKKGTTTLATGMIRGGCSKYYSNDSYSGGGINVDYGDIAVTSGLIAYNSGDIRGGGIMARYQSNVYVNGGAIAYNNVAKDATSGGLGGGVYLSQSEFREIDGGVVAYNYSGEWAGGIYLAYNGNVTLNMDVKRDASGAPVKSGDTGVSIIGNKARRYGGGICVRSLDLLKLGTCKVSGNMAGTGGGLYFEANAKTPEVHDNPEIMGNTNLTGVASNMYFISSNEKVKVTSTLTKNATPKIGVFMGTIGDFTTNFVSVMGTSAMASDYFMSDNPNYTVNIEANKEGSLILLNSYQAKWNSAVNTSLRNSGAEVSFDMNSPTSLTNWNATDGSFGTGVGFDSGALLVPAGANIKINLKTYAIDRKLTAARAKGYVIKVLGTLTITGTVSSRNNSTGEIVGGMITGGYCSDVNACGINIENGGTLNLQSGAIYNNKSSYDGTGGAGVRVNGTTAKFNMSGGYITKNICNAGSHDGGGLIISGAAIVTMTNGEISFNQTSGSNSAHGGGVMMSNGTFNMSGGTIKKNKSSGSGGGIFVEPGTINLSGGSIIENTAAFDRAASNRGGGTGLAGGIHMTGSATVNISGNVNVSKNTASSTGVSNDIELEKGGTPVIKVTGTLNTASSIGVSLTDRTAYTSGLKTAGGITTPSDVFFSNDPLYTALPNAAGELTFSQLTTYDEIWQASVNISKNNGGAPVKFTLASLSKSWEAASGSFGTTTGYYENGAILVPAGANIIIELAGYKIDRKLTAATANGYVLAVRGTATVQDSTNTTVNTSGALVPASGKPGGAITGGYNSTAQVPGGVLVAGTLNLNSGCVWGNKSSATDNRGGVGVCISSSGTMNLKGGYVSKNETVGTGGSLDGGGIDTVGTLNMTGGEVSYNKTSQGATSSGAGICFTGGTFKYTGGTIKGNVATGVGGGILINSANNSFSGTMNITGNTSKNGNEDIVLYGTYVIKIAGKLTASSAGKVYVFLHTAGNREITSGAGAAGMTIANLRSVFDSTLSTQIIGGKTVSDKLEAYLGKPVTAPTAVTTGLTYKNADITLVNNFDNSKVSATLSYAGGTASDVTAVTGKNAGSYKFVFTLKDGYVWNDSGLNYSADASTTKTLTVTIAKADLTNATLTIDTAAADIIYKAADWQPDYTATLYNLASSDYDVTWTNNKNAGTATLKITAKTTSTNFTGNKSVNFTIKKADLTDATTAYSGTYDGAAHTVTPGATGFQGTDTWANAAGKTIKYGTTSTAVTSASHPSIINVSDSKTVYYKISFDNYNDITGNKTVTINKFNISNTNSAVGSGSSIAALTDVTYTGAAQTKKPTVKVKLTSAGDTTLTETTNYTLAYSNSVFGASNTTGAGVITVTVTGTGNYTGTRTLTYNINKAKISAVEWDSKTGAVSYGYDGDEHKPVITKVTTENNGSLASGAVPSDLRTMFDYTYKDSSNAASACTEYGNYTAAAALKGDYAKNFEFTASLADGSDTGTTQKAFEITLATITAITVTAYVQTYDRKKHAAFTAKSATTKGGQTETWWYYYDSTDSVASWSDIADGNWTTTMPEFTDAGSYTVFYKITADNHTTTGGSRTVTINKKSISGAYNASSGSLNGSILPASLDSVDYTGNAVTEKSDLTVAVMLSATDEYALKYTDALKEYTLAFSNNIKAGTATITITGTGNYTGSRTINFTINKVDITGITLTPYSGTFDGEAHDVIKSYAATLVNGADDTANTATWYFRLDGDAAWGAANVMPKLTNATTGTKVFYKIEAPNHNTIEGATYFETVVINKKDISADYRLNDGNPLADMKYTGAALEPTFKVEQELTSGNWTKLINGTDFDFSYSDDHIEVGEYTVTVTGKGNYTGTNTIKFNIVNADAMTASAEAYGGTTGKVYDGLFHAAVQSQTVSAVGGNDGNNVQWWYSYDNLAAGDGGWSATVPEIKNVTEGTTVYWMVTADNNAPVLGSVTVIITPKKITSVDGIAADGKAYDGLNYYLSGENGSVKSDGAAAGVQLDGANNEKLTGYIASVEDLDEGKNKITRADDLKIVWADGITDEQKGTFDGKNKGNRSVTVPYTSLALGGGDAANYALDLSADIVIADVEISARVVKITWTGLDQTWDNNKELKPAATVSNVVSGETITTILEITQNGTVVSPKAPGDYHVEVIGLNGNTLGNYTLTGATDLEKTFSITTTSTVVFWNVDGLVYDGSAKQPKIYYEVTEDGSKVQKDITDNELEDGTSIVIKDASGNVVTEAINAGNYTVTLKLNPNHVWDGDLNGNNREKTISFTIAKAQVAGMKLGAKTDEVYDGAAHKLAVDWSAATLNGEAITAMPAGVTVTIYYNGVASDGVVNAGNYKVTAKFTVNGNFESIASIENVDLIIAKAEYKLESITFADLTKNYTGSAFTITAGGAWDATKVSVTYSYEKDGTKYGSDGVSAVGIYTVTAMFAFVNAADKDNYKLLVNGSEQTTLTATLTVNKEAANVTDVVFEDSLNEKYDGNIHRLLVSGAATGVKSVAYEYATDESFTSVVSTDGVKNAGAYFVKATFTVDDNYAPVDPIVKKLVIAKANLTVKANDKTIIYGENPKDAAYTATFTGLVGSDTESSLGTLKFDIVGYSIYGDAKIYEKVIKVSGLSSTNYNISYGDGDLTVKPREVTIKWYNDSIKAAQDLTYTYNGTEHKPYAEVTNAIPGYGVTVTVEGGRTAAGMNYEAKATGLSNANYALPESGLTVNFDILPEAPKSGKIIWDYTTLYYNGKEQKPKAYFFENEHDNSPKELSVTVNKTSINAGEYTATVLLDGNYSLTGETQFKFRIEKRTVHVVIEDLTTTYAGTIDLSGAKWSYASGSLEFVAGENYSINFSCGSTVTGPDTYILKAEFVSGNSANYEVIFSGSWSKAGDTANNGKWGTLTVTSAKYDMSKVAFTGAEVTYDGNAHELGISSLPAGVTVKSINYLLDGWDLGASGVTAAGTYTVLITFEGDEHFEPIPDMEKTLTIKKAALSVKANDKTITYGDSVAYNGVVCIINGVSYELTDAKLAGELSGTLTLGVEDGYNGNAGKYKILPAGLASDNYEISFVPGTLTVKPREITVIWYSDPTASSTNLNYSYDGNKHTPYPVASGLLGSDTVEFSVDGGQTEAGLNYTATITAVSNGNYAVSTATASVKFSIVQKGVIIWDNTPLVYEKGKTQAPAAWYYDEDDEELKELAVSGAQEDAGKYTATVTGTLPSYISSENISVEFEILAKDVTIEIGTAADLVYGIVEGPANLEQVLADLKASITFEGDISKITLECKVDNSTAVGAYTITGKCTDNNYNVTFVNGTLKIVKAPVTDNGTLAAFDGKTETVKYDGKAHTIEVSGDLPAGVTGVTYKYYSAKLGKYVAASEVVGADVYTIEAIFTVDGNHEEVSGTYTATITITKAEFTVAFDKTSYEFDYDGKLHSAKVTGDLTGIKSVKYYYDGTELSGVKDANTYTVTAVIEVEDADNYSAVTLAPVMLTINKIEITVTANDGSVVYGTDLTTVEGFGYTVTGLPANDAGDIDAILGTVAYSYGTVTGAGVYNITISGNASSANYSAIHYKDGKLTVTPYKLTADNVKWLDKENGAEATDGKFVYTYKAGTVQQPYAVAVDLLNGDTITLVVEGGQINAGYGYQAQIVRIEGANAKNYMLPAEGLKITFDIIPAPKTGTIIWDNSPLYYNGENLKPKAYYFLEEGGERIELTVTVDGDSKNAGKYTATVNLDGIDVELSGDKSKEFSVVARQVYVEIGNLDVQFGDTPNMSAVTWKYVYTDDTTKQFLGGEIFKITFSCGTATAVGTYPISAQFICDNSANYEVIFTGNWASAGADNGKYGTLTIFKASYDMSKVTFVGTEVTYDGKLHTVSVIGLPEGVSIASVTYEKDGFGYDANGVKNAGVYNVTLKFTGNENYGEIEDMTATLTIKKAALTIKANDKTIIYGEQPSADGVSYSGFADGEENNNDLKGVLSYAYGYVFGGNVGKYDITPAGFTSENYEITYKVGTLTVAPRTITVIWYDDETLSSQDFVYHYDEQYHAPYAVAGNLVEGDSLTLKVDGATDLPGFNFVATVAEITNANYKLPNDTTVVRTFSVMPAPSRSIVWDNDPIYYNGQNRKPKAYYVEDDGSWTEITDIRITKGGVTQTVYKNVGDYTATTVYKGVTSSQVFSILPVIVTVEIGNAEVVYGGTPDMTKVEWKYADGSNEFIASDIAGGAPVSFRCPTVNTLSPVGKYDILGSCTNGNYTVTFVNGTLTVFKANYDEEMKSVVYGDLTATYDGAEHTITISNLPAGVTATVTYEKDGKVYGANGVREAGVYNVVIAFAIPDTVNYELIKDVEQTLTIEKKAADVTGVIFHNTTKTVTYNGEAQEMYVSGTAVGVMGVTYTYYKADGVTKVAGGAINAGTYKVKAEFAIDANYNGDGIGEMWATLVINQAKLTVTAADGSVTYGETADVNGYGYALNGLVGGETEADVFTAISFSYGAYGNADTYVNAIEISGTVTAAAANYDVEYVFGTLTVTPREITVTWFDEENGTEYGGTAFEYEYVAGKEYIPYAKAGNLVGADALTLDVQVKRIDAGDNYVATVQTLANGNYKLPANGITVSFTIRYNNADLPDHINEIVWDNGALYYNKDGQRPSARYYDGTQWIDVTADLVIKDNAGNVIANAVDAGDYTAEYVADATQFSNLTFSFRIVPREVYIVIGDMQIKFGETPDMSKVSWKYLYEDADKQFISGDAYTLTFSTEEITSAKKYPISGTFGGNANYNVIFAGASWATAGADNGAYGTLTVNRATYDMSRVTFTGIDVIYNGDIQKITVNGLPEGVEAASVTYTKGGWTYNGGVTNAGAYTVTISFTGDENHEAIADMTATLTVRKAALTVTANDSTITYGDAPAAAGVTYAGLAESDADANGEPKTNVFGSAITFEYNYLKGGNVGEYNITPKGLTAENYVITYVSGTLTVNKRVVTISWYNDERMNSQTLTYNVDGSVHLPYAEAGNIVAGDSVVLTVDPSCAQSAAGIKYQAKIIAISNANYTLPENTAVFFEIVPDAYVVVWESMPFVFNGESQAPNAYYYTVNGERVPLLVTVQEGESVEAGTYHASASLISGNVELKGELTGHEFTIAKRAVTVVINDATSAYGEEIVLNGWTYADGSERFASGEPFYIVPPATSASGVGEYAITGRCTDEDNYIVTVINGTYTITKALIYAPELAGKVYTGQPLRADIAASNRYTVIYNAYEKEVGVYTVILLLNDYNNCKWADTNSQQYYVEFVIEQAENEWTTEFEIRGSVIAGSGNMFTTAPEAKFGKNEDIVIKYYTDESCEDKYEVTGEFIVTEAANGTYYAKVTLAGTDNYKELSSVYSFTVTGSLSIKLNWSNTTLTYNGLEQAPEAYVWLGGEQVMLVVTGAQKDAGTYEAETDLTAVDGRDLSGYEISASGASATVEFTINARNITVHIDDDAASVYGNAAVDLSRISWKVTQGRVMAGDELDITFSCAVYDVEFADAGEYPIIGECGNENYNVSFVGSWSGDDNYNGIAATYTVRKAVITVTKSESTWFDEDGLIDRYQNYFVYLDALNDDGSYKYITTKCGQEATVYYSTNIDKYNSTVHDNMTEKDIAQIFEHGGSKSAPEIKQAGNFVIYYRIEAENHEVKYGIWRVLIQPKDRYIIITFTKPYQVAYGESVEGKNLIQELIDGGYIQVSGAVIDLEELRGIAYAYAYEDVSSENGFVNGETAASKYSIRLVFTDPAANSEAYGNLEFRYSASNNPNSDTNYDKYVVLQRPITFNWTENKFVYDGELHLPSAKITGLVGGEEYELTGLQLGTNIVTLANDDVINVTVELVGSGDLTTVGNYHLRVTIDNANYKVAGNSDLVDVSIAQSDVKISWNQTSFAYDGNRHIPEATVTIGGEVFTLKDIVIGMPMQITLANGEVINVTVSLIGNSDMATGDYSLSVAVDNANYKIDADSQSVKVAITGYKEPFKLTLPNWAIYAIAGGIAFLLLLIIILIAVLKKRKPTVIMGGDDEGFGDDYYGE